MQPTDIRFLGGADIEHTTVQKCACTPTNIPPKSDDAPILALSYIPFDASMNGTNCTFVATGSPSVPKLHLQNPIIRLAEASIPSLHMLRLPPVVLFY